MSEWAEITSFSSTRPQTSQMVQRGNTGSFWRDSNLKFRDMTDGTSNTIMIGERAYFVGGEQASAGNLYAVRTADTTGPQPSNAADQVSQGMVSILGAGEDP